MQIETKSRSAALSERNSTSSIYPRIRGRNPIGGQDNNHQESVIRETRAVRKPKLDSISRDAQDVGLFCLPLNNDLLDSIPFEPWPIRNLEGKLPHFTSTDWTYPHRLVQRLEGDASFVQNHLEPHTEPDAQLFGYQLADLLPLFLILLHNGLDIGRMRRETDNTECTPIMAIIEDRKHRSKGVQSWSSSGIRLSMIRLLVAFSGLDDERSSFQEIRRKKILHWQRPLNVCLSQNDMEVFEALLDAGADPNEEDREHRNVLELAAMCGNLKAVRLLDKCGVYHKLSQKGSTALHTAAMFGHDECVQYFLNKRVPMYSTEYRGSSDREKTPLFQAARMGHVGVMNTLLCYGANPRATCFYFHSNRLESLEPLIVAAINDKLEVVKLLVEQAGVDANATTPDGRRILSFISKKTATGQYLVSKGAIVPSTTEKLKNKTGDIWRSL